MSRCASGRWRAFLADKTRLHVLTVDPGAHAMAREIVPIIRELGRLGSWLADGWSARQGEHSAPASELEDVVSPGDTLILSSQTHFERTQALIARSRQLHITTIFVFDHWKNYGEHFGAGLATDAIAVPDDIARRCVLSALGERAEGRVVVLPHLAIEASADKIRRSAARLQRGLVSMLLDPTEMTDGLGYDWRRALNAAERRAVQRGATRLMVKPHPRQDQALIADGLREFILAGVNADLYAGDVEALIAQSEEVWGMTTIALNAALAAGKRIVSFQPARSPKGVLASNPHIEPFVVT